MAQSVERILGKDEVSSSILLSSTGFQGLSKKVSPWVFPILGGFFFCKNMLKKMRKGDTVCGQKEKDVSRRLKRMELSIGVSLRACEEGCCRIMTQPIKLSFK